jgi:molybdopterin biosynthesis enzyme
LISTLTRADGFVLVPEGVERWPAGTSVEVRTYEP